MRDGIYPSGNITAQWFVKKKTALKIRLSSGRASVAPALEGITRKKLSIALSRQRGTLDRHLVAITNRAHYSFVCFASLMY